MKNRCTGLPSYGTLYNKIWDIFDPGSETLTLIFEQYEHYIREEFLERVVINNILYGGELKILNNGGRQ